MPRPDPSLAEDVCLALVAEAPTHGWAVAALLAPDGPLGRIWTLSRPLTYRALDQLATDGLVERRGNAPGKGRDRRIVAATPAGRRRVRTWLDQPVGHVREVRTELLVKLELRRRRGLDLVPLLRAQQVRVAPLVERFEAQAAADPSDLVLLWRRESARTVARFLDTALTEELSG